MNSLKMIDENADYWVIDKPAGVLSKRPTLPSSRPCLEDWFLEKGVKAFIVHRLDVETSGVMLVAKTKEAHQRLNQYFLEKKVKKTYLFLAKGILNKPTQLVRMELSGKPSSTMIEKCFQNDGFLAGKAFPQTGRRHQIRLHLKSLDCPILGDTKYGGWSGAPRVMLHAKELRLPDGKVYEAEIPNDFANLAKKLGLSF